MWPDEIMWAVLTPLRITPLSFLYQRALYPWIIKYPLERLWSRHHGLCKQKCKHYCYNNWLQRHCQSSSFWTISWRCNCLQYWSFRLRNRYRVVGEKLCQQTKCKSGIFEKKISDFVLGETSSGSFYTSKWPSRDSLGVWSFGQSWMCYWSSKFCHVKFFHESDFGTNWIMGMRLIRLRSDFFYTSNFCHGFLGTGTRYGQTVFCIVFLVVSSIFEK